MLSASKLVLYRGAVTVSFTGAVNQFQVNDNGHVGRPCEVSLVPPYPELFASYGASAVTRTSGRGHVAEARTNGNGETAFSVKSQQVRGRPRKTIIFHVYHSSPPGRDQ